VLEEEEDLPLGGLGQSGPVLSLHFFFAFLSFLFPVFLFEFIFKAHLIQK
jgi:hypothetical protein